MGFPEDVLPLLAELYLDGSWVDVTSHVYRRDMVRITRGRSSESDHVDRSTCALTFDNRDGRYSPRNPAGQYYGLLSRNTPIRVAVERGPSYLELPGATGDKITCPDAAALGITGDLDVRIDCTLLDWHAVSDLACKWVATGDQRSWALYINANVLVLDWSPTGSSTTLQSWTTVPVPFPPSGRQALRATLDVNNGASGHTVTFYRADTIDGPWEQLGDPVVTAGTTSVFDSLAGLEVGDIAVFAGDATAGKLHAFELRSGIGGTVVANPDLRIQTPGATSFADTASSPNTWTLEGGTSISNRRWRFHGEVSSWPPRWDLTGQDAHVPIEVAGVLRRVSRDGTVLGSALYRGIINAPGLIAYWPMEDVQGSTSLAPAMAHGPLSIIGSGLELAAFDAFVASSPLPVLGDAELRGNVPAYTDTGVTQIRFLLAVPAAGDGNDQGVVTVYTTGSVRRWEVHYGTGGTLGLRAVAGDGTTLADTGDIAFAVDGQRLLVAVELVQDGADIDYVLVTVEEGATVGSSTSGTLASHTVGKVGSIIVNPAGGLTGTTVGHLSVQNALTTVFDLGSQLNGWRSEAAGRRIQRLCEEEGLGFRAVGDLDATARLGAQRPDTLIALLRAAADTDAGMLFEPRDVLGLGYRTRESLYNQVSRLALDYEQHELAEALAPVDDDQSIVNDVTATREGGSSARAVQETGALSVQPPPAGVGRYPQEMTLAVEYDLDLFDQAAWRLHVGTVDEARYPQLAINFAHESFAGDTGLTDDALLLEVGDRVTVANLPPEMPPEAISQLVQGCVEELGNFEHSMVLNCSPASPYEVAVYDVQGRYESYGTVTAEALDSTETAVDIDTPTGPLWSTLASGFDVMIGGERMTVSAVGAATGTAQTLTVVRSVNGIVKAHQSGAEVRMFRPAIYAL
ncbi:hypothetical protein AB0C27_40480 [Nonomuraea sp. NPDC048882]|uniref:hypothetical protein n=1 Tax=Nonomuraea sp. NPDC048882 TaxID=3154347 RepID=UPI003400AE72